MEESVDEYFKKQNVYDINLMSTWGITKDEINILKEKGYDVEPSYSVDALIRIDDDYVVKVHSYDPNAKMNKLSVVEGRLPETNTECVIEKNKDLGNYKIGDTITIDNDTLKEKTLKIVGFVKSPLYISRERGSTKLLNGKVNFYMYSLITNFDSEYYTESYIKLNNNDSTYSKRYEQLINTEEDKLEVITNDFIETRFNNEKNDALKELNDNIDKYNKEKKDAYKKLDDAETKINKNEKTLNSNLTKLNNNEKKAKETFKTKKQEIETNKKKVNDGITTLKKNITYLESVGGDTTALKAQLSVLESNLKKLNDGYSTLLKQEKSTYKEISSARTKINNGKKQIEKARKELENNRKKADKEFADAYKKIEDARKEIDELEKPEWYILDLDSNVGYYSFTQDSERINKLAKVFPLLFYIVAVLVSLTTMTRMVEEERGELGTLKSLGYNDNQILFKYIIYALLATTIGSVLGVIIGSKTIPSIIYGMYSLMYTLGDFVNSFDLTSALLGSLIAIGCILSSKKIIKRSTSRIIKTKKSSNRKKSIIRKNTIHMETFIIFKKSNNKKCI